MKKELMRKFFHIFFGTIILLLIYILGTNLSLYLLLIFTIIGFLLGYLIKKGLKIKPLTSIITFVERENEKHFPGKAAVMFFLSSIIILLLFQQEKLLVISILGVQIYADGLAALIGKKFGKIKIINKKTVAGTSAFFIISYFCLFPFFDPLTAVFLAIIASVIEALPLDDNFSVPVGLGIIIELIKLI